MLIKLNIGTAVAGVDNALKLQDILETLGDFNIQWCKVKGAQSASEYTYIVTAEATGFDGDPVPDIGEVREAVFQVCLVLEQDAIAWRVLEGPGYLTGPKADEWGGEFNPEFFIE